MFDWHVSNGAMHRAAVRGERREDYPRKGPGSPDGLEERCLEKN